MENWLFEEGTALGLPVKIKLSNTLLGSSCYVGSNTEPIQIDLTTGASGALAYNLPVAGVMARPAFRVEYSHTVVRKSTLARSMAKNPTA